jgi:hypothetical protein
VKETKAAPEQRVGVLAAPWTLHRTLVTEPSNTVASSEFCFINILKFGRMPI